jgi:Transition state regulatory protein AbrB
VWALGSDFDLEPLTGLGGRWIPVAVVVVGTLGVSLLAGLAIAAVTGLDRPTALLGLVAGGAAGIVVLSDELGADARLVAVMQYARVLVVVLLAPLLMAFAFGEPAGSGGAGERGAGLAADLAYTVVAGGVGALAARRLNVPAASLLGPLAVGAALTAGGVLDGAGVPGLVEELAFAVIGVQVGVRFTRDTIRRAGRLLPRGARRRAGDGRGVRRAGPPAGGAGRRALLRRLPGHHARRHLRGARDGRRQRREHHVRHRRPSAAGADHRARRAPARAGAGAPPVLSRSSTAPAASLVASSPWS